MKKVQEIFIKNQEATKEFGHQLANQLEPGSVVALYGDLGSGKTTLTKYIGEALGINEMINSPTFAIIQEYRTGKLPLYHFDVYRLNNEDELFNLGYEEYFYGEGVTIIEWAEKIQAFLPDHAISIHLNYGTSEDQRIYRVEGLNGAEICGF